MYIKYIFCIFGEMLKSILLTIASQLYITGVKFRHWLFDSGAMRSEHFDTPIICVGNITVGGTGKTPMCELLIEHYSRECQVAIISRGYGRKSVGYREVAECDSYLDVGDEPLQMKLKYPDCVVVVCEKRAVGIKRVLSEHPEIGLIIMDDGFQHRAVTPKVNIIMVDATRPIDEDRPLPLGTLRDTADRLHCANIFVVTKSPLRMTAFDRSLFRRSLVTMPYQSIYFTRINNLDPVATYPDIAAPFDGSRAVVALAGIGNPKPFVEMLEQRYNLVDTIIYADHHRYAASDFNHIVSRLDEYPDAIIVTTEKDSIKFIRDASFPEELRSRIYYTAIKMNFVVDSEQSLLKNIDKDVRAN